MARQSDFWKDVINRFEDIDAWKESRELVRQVYGVINEIYSQAEKVSKLNSGFIKYLRSRLNKPKQPK